MIRFSASIDARSEQPLRRIWRFVGYDEPNYTYAPAGARLLHKIGRLADGPYWIRTHFLLCTGDERGRPKWGATNVVTLDERGELRFRWDTWDRIFDTILESGCRPFVEIGFTPEWLSTAPPGMRYDDEFRGGWRYPPRDLERWEEIVRAIAAHSRERFGSREVSRWYWELWNEPDIFYWEGTCAEYCALYDFTERALHETLPSARLGGPATTGPGDERAARFLREFLAHCARGRNAASGSVGTRLDFVTFHAKGAGYRRDPSAPKQTPSTEALIGHVVGGLDILAEFPDYAGIEVILSECDPDGWAAGGRHDNPNLQYRNTEYYASYFANAVCRLLEADGGRDTKPRVDGLLTWAFEFEGREYFEGLRTLSTNDVDKPILNALRLFSMLGSARVALEIASPPAPPGLELRGVAARADAALTLLLSCHHDDWDRSGDVRVELELSGLLPRCRYGMVRFRVDRDHANAFTTWRELGEPQSPDAALLERLHAAARLRPEAGELASDAEGRARVSLDASIHSVELVRFEPH